MSHPCLFALRGKSSSSLKQNLDFLLNAQYTKSPRNFFIAETIEKLGSLDILVNNAGILEMGTIENTSLDQYDRIMNTNVRAIYQLTMLAVPHLVKTQGNDGDDLNES